MARQVGTDAVLVIGLGRFGSALASVLERLDHEVLAVDASTHLVQEWSGLITHAVQADCTSEAALRQLGAAEFPVAVVTIGSSVEASVLSAGVLLDIGVPEVWAKASTLAHGRILERIGVQHVVYPERQMGERVAHLLTGRILDFIEFDDDFAIVKMRAVRDVVGRTLGEAGLRRKYGVTIVGVKRPGEDFDYAQADTVVHERDMLIVAGQTELVEKFAATAEPVPVGGRVPR